MSDYNKELYKNPELPAALLNVELKYSYEKEFYQRIMKEIFKVVGIDDIGDRYFGNSDNSPVYTLWYWEAPDDEFPKIGSGDQKSIHTIDFKEFLSRVYTNFTMEHRILLKKIIIKISGRNEELEKLLYKKLISITTLPKILQPDGSKFMEVFGLDSTPKFVDMKSGYVYTIMGYTPDNKIYFYASTNMEVQYMDMEDLIVIPYHPGFFVNKYQILKI